MPDVMRWLDYESESCSIARALASLGDRWTILVLRDLFNGVHRFDDLLDHLGVSRDVLSKRLAAMVEDGIVERRPYRVEGSRPRSDYHLTPAGRELQPVLISLLTWGDKHRATGDGPPTLARAPGVRRPGEPAADLQRGPRRAALGGPERAPGGRTSAGRVTLSE